MFLNFTCSLTRMAEPDANTPVNQFLSRNEIFLFKIKEHTKHSILSVYE